jgi:uncharacterized iron-regulated protein
MFGASPMPWFFSFMRRGAGWPLLALGGCGLLVSGCANMNSGLALPKAGEPVPVSAPRELSAPERAFWDRITQARVIYIGETHNSNSDHEYQFDVLKGLKARGADFAIGWEMFDVTQQSMLDQWHARQITTDALLDKTDWKRTWGMESVMYETMLRWSQSEKVASLALNAPRSLSRKLALGQTLTPEERAMLPNGFQPLPGGYEHFAEQMSRHPHMGGAAPSLENVYKAQLLWEQTMANRIIEFLDAHADAKLVVLTGRGHLEGGFGIPGFVRQKTSARQIVLFPGGSAETRRPGGSLASRTRSRFAAKRAFLTFNLLLPTDESSRRP